jgi:hypothetical protein
MSVLLYSFEIITNDEKIFIEVKGLASKIVGIVKETIVMERICGPGLLIYFKLKIGW